MATYIYLSTRTDKPRDPFAERKVTVWRVFTAGRWPDHVGDRTERNQDPTYMVCEILRGYDGLHRQQPFPEVITDPHKEIKAMAAEGIYIFPI